MQLILKVRPNQTNLHKLKFYQNEIPCLTSENHHDIGRENKSR